MTSRVKFSTDTGRAQYPWLNEPDTKFDDEGIYKSNLIMSKDQAQPLIDEIQELAQGLGKKLSRARLPFDQDEDTGEIIFKAKSRKEPRFFDTMGKYIEEGSRPRIFGGSRVRLKGTFLLYDKGANCGVSMQIDGVQIVDLSQGEGGFDAVEGGTFVMAEQAAAKDTSEPADAEEDDFNF